MSELLRSAFARSPRKYTGALGQAFVAIGLAIGAAYRRVFHGADTIILWLLVALAARIQGHSSG